MPDRAARRREHAGLGEQLRAQAPSRRTERRAQRELAIARRRVGEQQVRDVGARDQQHGDDGGEDRPQRRARRCSKNAALIDWTPKTMPASVARVARAQTRRRELEIGRCRLHRRAGRQQRDRAEIARAALRGRHRSSAAVLQKSSRSSDPASGAGTRTFGATPTTSIGTPSKPMLLPTTFGSAPSCARQSRSEMTTRRTPGRPSAGVKNRPSSGRSPSTRKVIPARRPCRRSARGLPLPVSTAESCASPAIRCELRRVRAQDRRRRESRARLPATPR